MSGGGWERNDPEEIQGWSPDPGKPHSHVPKTNGAAIASLVLGILWIFWIGSILALFFGYTAKSQIDSGGGRESGRELAIAGIVLGWIGVGTLILVLLAGGCTVSVNSGSDSGF